MAVLEVQGLSHAFGEKVLYRNASFSLQRGMHMGVTGPNGAGKSTLIRMLTGEILPDEGDIIWQKGANVGYLDQQARLDGKQSILDYLHLAFGRLYQVEARLNALYAKMAHALSEHEEKEVSSLQNQLLKQGFYDIEHTIRRVASGLGLNAIGLDRPLDELSGGQREKVILAKLLLEKPDALVLDEPTNYLDTAHVAWLQDYLRTFAGAFIVVSHDEFFLDGVTSCILDIDCQTFNLYNGSFAKAMEQKARNRESQLRLYEAQQREIAALQAYIDKNRVRTATARQAQSRIKRLNRIERIAAPTAIQSARYDFMITPTGTAGRMEVNELSIGYDAPLLPPLNLMMRYGECLALTGFNGIGKTTLLKTLTGEIPALGGSFRFGEYAKIGYFAQESVWEDGELTPLRILRTYFPEQKDRALRTRLASFGIRAELCQRPVATLSGGEQAKVRLCLLAQKPCNLLMLDEPTSHLDASAKLALGNALNRFPGSIILVTHEEDFLRDLADRVVNFEQLLKKKQPAPTGLTPAAKSSLAQSKPAKPRKK